MKNHDPEDVADVSDGDEVLAGVTPPTKTELAAATQRSDAELQAVVDEHVAEVNIHDDRDR